MQRGAHSKTYQWLYLRPTFWILLWGVLGVLQVYSKGYIDFNVYEIVLGKNLFQGWGYVFSPTDPPGVSRPLLASLYCGVIGLFVSHPADIYKVLHIGCLGSFLLSVFFLVRLLLGIRAAHTAMVLLFGLPMLVSFPWISNHYASHLAFLSVVGWATWAAIRCWKTPSSTNALIAGALWGLTFLGRYETLIHFGVILLFAILFLRPRVRILYLILPFLLVVFAKESYFRWAAAKYGIIADTGLYTFYAGEAHSRSPEGTTPNGDNLGYELSQKIYGSVEENRGSLLVVIAKHPGLVWERFQRNFRRAYSLMFQSRVFIFSPLFFLLLVWLHPLARNYRPYALFFLLLHLSAYSTLLFHIDTRYLTPAISYLVFLLALSLGVLTATILPRLTLPLRVVTSTLTLFVLVCMYTKTSFVPETPQGAKVSSEGLTEVGKYLKATDSKVPVVRAEISGQDKLLFYPYLSYFAEVAIPWEFTGPLPLDRMAAFSTKKPDYLLVNAAILKAHPEFQQKKLAFQTSSRAYGELFLLHE